MPAVNELIRKQRRFAEISKIVADPFLTSDMAQLMIGERIGSGESRAVYTCNLAKDSVIKIGDLDANKSEWCIWQQSQGTDLANWLAACYFISPCGNFLIQQRVDHVDDQHILPKQLPSIFEDIKRTNFGYIGDRLVCFDYAKMSELLGSTTLNKLDAVWKP
jgi:hypothetical protein